MGEQVAAGNPFERTQEAVQGKTPSGRLPVFVHIKGAASRLGTTNRRSPCCTHEKPGPQEDRVFNTLNRNALRISVLRNYRADRVGSIPRSVAGTVLGSVAAVARAVSGAVPAAAVAVATTTAAAITAAVSLAQHHAVFKSASLVERVRKRG